MKKWITGFAVIVLGFINVTGAQVASADSLDDIRQQQEQKQDAIDSLQGKIAQALEETSAMNEEIESLNTEITEKEETIEKQEAAVAEQEAIVEARLEQARQRLQAIQTNDVNDDIVMAIIEAENFTEFFTRTLAVVQLADAGNQMLEEAQIEVDKLADMKDKLVTEQEELKSDLALVSEQKATYDEKLASLQTLVNENQSELTQLQTREADEEARIEKARAAARAEAVKAAEERAASEAAVVTTSSTADETSNEAVTVEAAEADNTAEEQPKESEETEQKTESSNNASSKSGRTITVSATGYSMQQANLSTHTATNIDLRINPRVIAVDPSVIPLGSTVEIPGKGIYIAGDTGSAIKGNKIDIHFSTVSEAFAWGRRTITIRVLD